MQRLADFKAEFENLAESSLDDNESNGTGDGRDGSGAGCGDEKWKLRVKKIQKYAKWQLAEAETQVQRTLTLGLVLLPSTLNQPREIHIPLKQDRVVALAAGRVQSNLCCTDEPSSGVQYTHAVLFRHTRPNYLNNAPL